MRYDPGMKLGNTTGIRLPPELLAWLREHAAKRQKILRRQFTASDAIRIAIEEYRERNGP